jgi:hypothetical protein
MTARENASDTLLTRRPPRNRWPFAARLLWLITAVVYGGFFIVSSQVLLRNTSQGIVGVALQPAMDGRLAVASVLPGMPAAQIGIRPGEILLEIDHTRLARGTGVAEASALLRGPFDTPIRVVVQDARGRARELFVLRGEGQPGWLALRGYGIGPRVFAWYALASDIAILLAFGVASVLVAWRSRRAHPGGLPLGMAVFTSVTLVMLAATLGNSFFLLVNEPGLLGWAGGSLVTLALACGFILLYVFPDGRFVPRWIVYLAVLQIVWALVQTVFPGLNANHWPRAHYLVLYMTLLAIGVAAQAYRYFYEANPAQREQTKWVVLGVVAMAAGYLIASLPRVVMPEVTRPGVAAAAFYLFVQVPAFNFTRVLLAVALTVSILRYRLWDVDLIIRRTLIYGAVTAVLAGLYLLGVALFQFIFRGATGESSDLAVILSTLGAAALFTPLRARMQIFIDRRFYRRRYDAGRVLAAFSHTVRDQMDLDVLAANLVDVVDAAMQPSELSLWLCGSGRAGKTRNAPAESRSEVGTF